MSSNAPSIDIKDMIEDSNSGLSLVFNTDLFIASMPDSPHDCICIYDTGGGEQGQYNFERPNVQIRIRNLDYITGYNLARDIKDYLHQARNGETWNGTRYISIDLRSAILFLGQDDKNRYEFTINFLINRSGN